MLNSNYVGFANYEKRDFYPDVAESLANEEVRLEELRREWSATLDQSERDALERSAWGANERIISKSSRLNRHADELIAERNFQALADDGYFLRYDDPQSITPAYREDRSNWSDEDWREWKLNQFIRNIARRVNGKLYLGTVHIEERDANNMIAFRCYAGSCKFRACHWVGGSEVIAQLIVSKVLAHTYKHSH